jgi:zinc/manganese transport system substrate-binding protein
VLAGENTWGDIARQIGGPDVSVISLINDSSTDPHDYESNPIDAAAVARARIVIENGAGYDDFLDKLLAAAGGSKQVLNVQRIAGLSGSAADSANPHFWYSPEYVTKTAHAIEQQLQADEPAHAASFRANLATFLKAYQPYIDTIAEIRRTYGGQAVAYTERVPGYLIDAAGLRLGVPASFAQAIEDGTDPTPHDTAQFDAALKERKVKVLLYNAQVVDDRTKAAKETATQAGVPVVGILENLPKDQPSFQAWQISQAKALLSALGG